MSTIVEATQIAAEVVDRIVDAKIVSLYAGDVAVSAFNLGIAATTSEAVDRFIEHYDVDEFHQREHIYDDGRTCRSAWTMRNGDVYIDVSFWKGVQP